jgi:hypothetical protein
MPFSHIKTDYQPEQLAQMTEAFHLAWPSISRANGAFLQADIDRLRERLADFILGCARQGEFNPETLKDRALRALTSTPEVSAEAT